MKILIFSLLCSIISAFSSNSRVFVGTPAKQARLVKDCMTPNPIFSLKPTHTVNEAIADLLRLNLNGAPVVDPSTKNLVGFISAFDFLQKENGGAVLPMQGSVQEMGAIMNVARKIVATTVGELMTPNPLTISPDVSMRDAASLMAKHRTHRLCVVNEEGELIGILSTSDVMNDVLDAVHQALPEVSTKTKRDNELSP